jgi:agmatinase
MQPMGRPDEPSYAGGATFSKVPLVLDPQELEGHDVAIVGAPIDETVSYRPGARFGPRAIRLADVNGAVPMSAPNMDAGVDPFEVLSIVDHGDAPIVPADAARSHEAIRRTVGDVVAAGLVPVILGGDHSIAHPDVGAVAAALAPEPIGLVHFDAHADDAAELWGVTRSHGTPMRLLVEEGSIRGTDVFQVGLRGYWPGPEEFAWAREQGFRWHLMEDVVERGIEAVTGDVIDGLGGLSHVFLSVDIDVCDPAYAPGTGTPEPGGLQARELLRAVRRLAIELPLAGLEVVEVSPPYDHAELTAMLAHRVVLEALTGLALRRSGRRPERERHGVPRRSPADGG